MPGTNKSNRPNNNTRIDKAQLKCDCINGFLFNGIQYQQPALYNFDLSSPPSHKVYEEQRIKLSKKSNNPVPSLITFYLEDDDHKVVDFNQETIRYICQLVKIK